MTRLSLRIVEELNTKMKEIAKDKGLSLNALIVQMCWQFVEEWESRSVKSK